MTIEELLKDAKDWWKQHAEREMEKKETLVSRFETAVKRMEQLHTLVSVDKRWSIKVSNKIPAVPWRNDISASGLMISPQNGTDLANVSISANGVTYTFPAGSTAATVIPLGLPGDVITISGTSATMAVMDLRALGQEETLRFLMRPFGSTVIVGNTVNAQLTGSNPSSKTGPTLIASGTAPVGSGVSFISIAVTQPAVLYDNYLFVFYNASGQTVSNVGSSLTTKGVPGYSSGLTASTANATMKSGQGVTGSASAAWWPNDASVDMFGGGDGATIYPNFAAATTAASSMPWALYGY